MAGRTEADRTFGEIKRGKVQSCGIERKRGGNHDPEGFPERCLLPWDSHP